MIKKEVLAGMTLLLSALIFQSCTSADKPEQTAGEVKKQVEAAAPKTEALPVQAAQAGPSGEELFNKHCIVCHRNGGNIINPKKPIGRAALEANNISTPDDIIHVMRNPGKGMKRFDEAALPDEEARAIAEYILEAFK